MVGRTITFRFPVEIIEAIEARAKVTQSNRTAVVLEALVQAYGFPSTDAGAAPAATDTLQVQLNRLEQKVVTLLTQLVKSPVELASRLAVMDAAVEVNGTHQPATQADRSLSQQCEVEVRKLDQILCTGQKFKSMKELID